ncbi:unnamed protein product [Dibothriocephalus latus]|uniref:DH domain-containing protein n=1 Tax=Dibothriocephalus latus TaxID=60516 RepID=A0A3P7NRR5_DIBLA|nr:unnamed protein product [Dibothriocephalus latus]
MMDLERLARSRPAFGQKIQEIESQKFCYLPFYAFLLKPMHRLLQYRAILERLMRQYSESHVDMQDCRGESSSTPSLVVYRRFYRGKPSFLIDMPAESGLLCGPEGELSPRDPF